MWPQALIELVPSVSEIFEFRNFETSNSESPDPFVKVGGSYHAYINELPNQMPWAKCPALWWDAPTRG